MAFKLPEFFDGLVGSLLGKKTKDTLVSVINDITTKKEDVKESDVVMSTPEITVADVTETPKPRKRKTKLFED